MNGDWYPWSEVRNGNSAGQYVAAWRHVHDIFAAVGATNVSWVWSPNTTYAGSIPLSRLYPGGAYVDWVGIDTYNWGSNPARGGWQSFAQGVTPTYDTVAALAPEKPMMLPEVGSTESGGSKAAWITDALTSIPTAFPRIRAVVWFNWDVEMDWSIESSKSAQTAFATGIASPVYTGSEFSAQPPGPIPAP
jgi:beta-mannanase